MGGHSVSITTRDINVSGVSLSFAFFHSPKQSAKGRHTRGLEVNNLITQGLGCDIFFGEDYCMEVRYDTTQRNDDNCQRPTVGIPHVFFRRKTTRSVTLSVCLNPWNKQDESGTWNMKP